MISQIIPIETPFDEIPIGQLFGLRNIGRGQREMSRKRLDGFHTRARRTFGLEEIFWLVVGCSLLQSGFKNFYKPMCIRFKAIMR